MVCKSLTSTKKVHKCIVLSQVILFLTKVFIMFPARASRYRRHDGRDGGAGPPPGVPSSLGPLSRPGPPGSRGARPAPTRARGGHQDIGQVPQAHQDPGEELFERRSGDQERRLRKR